MKKTVCLPIACVVLSVSALSSQAASRDEQARACRGDAIHFCAAEIPNHEKIAACLKQHLDELTPDCRGMFSASPKRNGKAASQ